MGLVVLTGALADDWLYICQGQNLAYGDLRFIPFEDEYAVWPQHPECLPEPCTQVITPRFFVKLPVLFSHPRIVANSFEMGWIEHDYRESVVSEWQRAEVGDQVWPYTWLDIVVTGYPDGRDPESLPRVP